MTAFINCTCMFEGYINLPVPIYTKDILNHTCFHPWQPSHLKHEPTNQCPKNVNTYLHTYLVSFKTLIGSLFPLLPLRVKCQNHERVPISTIFMVNVLASEETWTTKIGDLMVLALHPGKTLRRSLFPLLPLRVKCQNHERVPISPISPIFIRH